MKRYLLILALCLFAGCASWRNDIAADGGPHTRETTSSSVSLVVSSWMSGF